MVLELVCLSALVVYVIVIWAIKEWRQRRREELGRLPPGPRGLPVLGNIFQLRWPPHISLSELALKHGGVMTIRLGLLRTVVISSKEMAREMFKNHDVILAGRKVYESMKGMKGNEGSLITAQYGSHWRLLRRVCTSALFVTSRLEEMREVRGRCISNMVQNMVEDSEGGAKAIDVGRFVFLMNFNLIGNLIFSKDLLDITSKRGGEFFFHAGKIMELSGKPNVADFFPMLQWLDPQGIRRKTQYHVGQAFDIAGEFIKERMSEMNNVGGGKKHDFLTELLEFQGNGNEEPVFTARTINAITLEMFIAGTDTTTSTLEWAIAELIRHPKAMRKVQDELREVIKSYRKLEENDLENLPYLKAVIKETLRLHPPLPFLLPHMARDTCNMLGYYIPKETQVLVNVWAIGRDPDSWKDPLVFLPERFLEEMDSVDYKGHNYEYLPFGSGRRICPAIPLASRVLPLALGALLHSFNWVLPDGLKPENLDMTERMGLTLRKAVHLKAIPVPYKGNIARI